MLVAEASIDPPEQVPVKKPAPVKRVTSKVPVDERKESDDESVHEVEPELNETWKEATNDVDLPFFTLDDKNGGINPKLHNPEPDSYASWFKVCLFYCLRQYLGYFY